MSALYAASLIDIDLFIVITHWKKQQLEDSILHTFLHGNVVGTEEK
jgi:hypothetical protein